MPEQVASLYAKISADYSDLSSGLSNAKNELSMFQNAMGNAGNFFSSTVKVMGATMGLAAAGIGIAVAKTGFEFDSMKESALIAFTTMLGSAEEAQSFLEKMESFAAKTPFEFPDLITASQRLMALGFTSEEVLPMLTSIGDAVAAMGGNSVMIDRVTTALGQMRAKGKVQAEEMMQLTENGIAAWDMLAAKLGVDVATAMDMVTKRQVDAAVGIEAIMEGINTNFGGMMEKQSTSWAGMVSNLKDSFGILSGQVMQPFFDLAKEGLQWLVAFTSSSSFTQGVRDFSEALKVTTEWLKETIATGNIFGSTFAALPEPIRNVVTVVNDLVTKVSAFLQPVATAISQAVVWQDALAAIGAIVIWVVGTALAPLITTAIAVAAIFAALVLASAVLRAAWTGDWSGIIDFVTKELPTFANKLMEWGKAAWEWLTAAIPLVIKAISDWAAALYKWINDNASKWLDTLGKWGKAAWEWIVQATSTAVQKLGEWGSGLLRWLSDNLPNWIKMIYEWATALVEWITDAIPGAITALTNFIHGIRTKGESEGTPAFVKLVGEWATKFWRWIVDDLIPAVGPAFVKFITALMTLGQELLVAIGGLAVELGLLLWEWIVDVTPTAVQKLGEWGKALWGWITDNTPAWVEKLTKWATAAWEWIVEATGPAVQKLGEWGRALWGWIVDNAPAWMQKLAAWGKAAWEWIVDMTPVALQKLSEFGRQLISWVGEKSREWATKFLEAGRDLIDGFRKGIEEKWTSMTSWFSSKWTDLANKFKNFFGIHSPSTMFRDFGNDLMAGLKGGIEDGALHPVNAAASVASRVKEQMDAMIRDVNNSAAKINAVVFNPGSNSGGTGTGTGGVLPPVTGGSSTPPKTAAEIAKEQAIAYGGYRLDVAVGQVAGLTDITNWGTEFKQFLGAVSGIAQTYNLAGVGSEQAAAVQTINSGAIFETKVDDVLAAIQVLLRTLSEKGLGNQFFVEAPPNADLNAKYELIELVNYLQALYG